MSSSYNKVILLGHLTRDPELVSAGSTQVCKFAIATNRTYKNQTTGQTVSETMFVDVEAWGKQGELIAQYLRKGSLIFLDGRLRYNTWEDKKGKRNKISVTLETFQFVHAQPEEEPPKRARRKKETQPKESSGLPVDDDIPF